MTTPAIPDIALLPGTVRDGFARIGTAAVGAFGPTPLRRLVAGHLPLFVELRRLGAGWSQIAALLAAHGVVAHDGPVGTEVLRAIYAGARAGPAAGNPAKRNKTQRNATKRNAEKRSATKRSEAQRNEHQRDETQRNGMNRNAASGNDAAPNAQHRWTDHDGSADGGARSSLRTRIEFLNRQRKGCLMSDLPPPTNLDSAAKLVILKPASALSSNTVSNRTHRERLLSSAVPRARSSSAWASTAASENRLPPKQGGRGEPDPDRTAPRVRARPGRRRREAGRPRHRRSRAPVTAYLRTTSKANVA
jgi:hypothetical protein